MSAPDPPGRCLLVDLTPAEEALLAALPDAEDVPAGGLDSAVLAGRPPVDLVVVGSRAQVPVALVQQVHRLLPDAGVAVLTDDVAALRRQVSFAPAVPLDVLVAEASPQLIEQLDRLRDTRRAARRHAAVLAAVAQHAAAATGGSPSPHTAVGALLEHAPIAVLLATPSGELLGWNRRAELVFDLRPEMSGWLVDDVVPGARGLREARAAEAGPGGGQRLQVRVGGRADVEVSAVRTQTDQGRPVVLFLAVDVTARREAEQERDRLAGQVQLLGRVTEALIQSLDLKESMSRLAGALVPALADWVSIQARGENEQLYDNVIRHRVPALRSLTRAMEQLKARRNVFTEPSRLANEGLTVLVPDIDHEQLAVQVPDAELRGIVARLGMGSALSVPIPGRVGLHGSLLLVKEPGRGHFEDGDRALAIEIGRRAGIALDNARLYAGQRYVATELQQSLLTAPPQLSHAEIAVRYVAAAQEAQVGGDWYDAFRRADGDLMVAIGDVVGHDTRAAAAMGQVRGLLRGIAYTTSDRPDRVLTSVDRAIEGLELAAMATAVLGQLSPTHDGCTMRLSWSNAGHPPPVLLLPDGHARLLAPSRGRADLLLGIEAATARGTETALLPCGSTLLLYTDGLVERRTQPIDEGIERLLAFVESHAGEDLDRFCDALLGSMVPQAGEDDVALVAVRPRAVRPGGAPGPDRPASVGARSSGR